MFSSPARPIKGTPRRTGTLSRAPRTPSIYSEREHEAIPPPSTARTNRLAHLRRDESPSTSVAETVRTVREVEGYEKISWSRDDRRAINSLGALPKEVNALVQSLDGDSRLINGVVDTSSGYAMVATSSGCRAWNYVKRTNASPTCYTFPSPSQYRTSDPVLADFFSGSSSEPGVIMITPEGEIRTWENISLGLGNLDRYLETDLELGEDDAVDKLYKLNEHEFVVTTRKSFVFRISVTISAGRATPNVSSFTTSRGMFSRASPIIFSNEDDRNGVVSIALKGNELFLLAWRVLQRWSLSQDNQKLAQEYDIVDLIGEGVFGDEWKQQKVKLEINDIAKLDDSLVALVGWVGDESASTSQSEQRTYGLAVLENSGKTISVSRFIDLAYTPTTRNHPRLLLPAGNPMAYIRFSDTLVMLSLSPNAPYEDVITLKAPNTFLGYGCRQTQKKSANQASLVLMPATGGLMSVEAQDLSTRFEAEGSASATSSLQSKIEQAVFFGERSDNPLSFSLQSDIEGDVGEAVEHVSNDIVASSSKYMPAIYELRSQLSDRANRLRYLISFIRESGLMSKITQSSRRRLQRNAEKFQAAMELWDHQNRLMDKIGTRSPQSLLSDSIRAYMSSVNPTASEDVIRLFFRTQVNNLDKLLDLVFATFRAATNGQPDISDWAIEVNTIFLRALRESARLREDEQHLYEIDRLRPAIELWTSQDSFLSTMEYLFFATEQLIQDRTRDLGSVIDERPIEGGDDRLHREQVKQERLKDQMTNIGASLCINMEDRVRFASTQVDGDLNDRGGRAMGERWIALRPKIIKPMVDIDRVANAYNLAEHHQDWETLVWLCHHPLAGRGPTEVQKYIELYGEEFAFVLYQWYIDNDHRHALLSQDKVYSGLVSRFFAESNPRYPELAWMHHLACKRYGEAASDLLVVNKEEQDLAQKHLLSSIGKLAAVVERKALGVQAKRRELLEDLDDELDDIKVQNTLRESLIVDAPTPRRGARPSMEEYATNHSTSTENRPNLRNLFIHFAQKLVDGWALDTEALVDVLTLKDNESGSTKDPIVALEKLFRDTELPSGRRQVVLLSIWRRAYIRDDWEEIANTSGRSDEAQRQLLRQTLAYQTLKNMAASTVLPADYELDPEQASQEPLMIELSARFHDWQAEDLEGLMRDHESEIAQLDLWRDSGIDGMIKEVKELLKRDMEHDTGVEVDVVMS